MRYVDGFVIPVPKRNLEKYRRMARKAGKVWKEHGAIEVRECVGQDLKPKMAVEMGSATFPRIAKVKPGETVVFSWIVFKSRAARDRINAKVMNDPRLADMMDPDNVVFDSKRMTYGGFETLVDL
jgi:uncharacterized protein YbaA (DUF1428 family)